MRIHQDIVAISFLDFRTFLNEVKDIFRNLLDVPTYDKVITIVFDWSKKPGLDVFVHSENTTLITSCLCPEGVTSENWAGLIADYLENCIMMSSKFRVTGIRLRVEKGALSIDVERV